MPSEQIIKVEDHRDRLFRQWAALKDACRASHGKGPGGSRVCVCGANCGGSSACSMLATLRDLIRYLPTGTLPETYQKLLADLNSVIH